MESRSSRSSQQRDTPSQRSTPVRTAESVLRNTPVRTTEQRSTSVHTVDSVQRNTPVHNHANDNSDLYVQQFAPRKPVENNQTHVQPLADYVLSSSPEHQFELMKPRATVQLEKHVEQNLSRGNSITAEDLKRRKTSIPLLQSTNQLPPRIRNSRVYTHSDVSSSIESSTGSDRKTGSGGSNGKRSDCSTDRSARSDDSKDKRSEESLSIKSAGGNSGGRKAGNRSDIIR